MWQDLLTALQDQDFAASVGQLLANTLGAAIMLALIPSALHSVSRIMGVDDWETSPYGDGAPEATDEEMAAYEAQFAGDAPDGYASWDDWEEEHPEGDGPGPDLSEDGEGNPYEPQQTTGDYCAWCGDPECDGASDDTVCPLYLDEEEDVA